MLLSCEQMQSFIVIFLRMRILHLVSILLSFGLTSAHLLSHRKVTAQLTGKSMNSKMPIPVYYKYLNKCLQKKEKFNINQKKEDYSSNSMPLVSSLTAKMPLQEILAGNEYNGSIVSIRRNGFFVDIGAEKDGFVHIKDTSEKYFVDNLWSRFSIGQVINVFVKYVDAQNKSLACQLYPMRNDEFEQNKLNWTNISPEIRVDGLVVRSSNYGVYVDIGAPVLGFLHRRKMLSNRRQRKLKPWEVCPLGSKQQCFVYNIDEKRQRIELTTYPPSKWESIFGMFTTIPPSDEMFVSAEDTEVMTEQEDMERSVLINDEDDDVEEEYDEEDDFGEVDLQHDRSIIKKTTKNLKANEIAQIVHQRSSNNNKLIEDFDDDPLESTSMMFQEVSEGRSRISFRDLLSWDTLTAILHHHTISRDKLKNLFLRSGTISGQLDEKGFERFIHMLDHEIENNSAPQLCEKSH